MTQLLTMTTTQKFPSLKLTPSPFHADGMFRRPAQLQGEEQEDGGGDGGRLSGHSEHMNWCMRRKNSKPSPTSWTKRLPKCPATRRDSTLPFSVPVLSKLLFSLFVTTPPPFHAAIFVAIFLKSFFVRAKFILLFSLSDSWLLQSSCDGFFSIDFMKILTRVFFSPFLVWRLVGRPFNACWTKTKLILIIYNYCNLYVSHYQDEHFFSSCESIIHKNTIFFRPAIERIKKHPPNPYTL